MDDKPLSPTQCHGCGAAATDAGIVAEYDGVPFARLCAACAGTVAGRYAFLGAVFTAFPHRDDLLRLAVVGSLATETRDAVVAAVTEVAAARGVAQ